MSYRGHTLHLYICCIHFITRKERQAKSALDFQVGGGIDLSRPIFIMSVLVGSSAHQKGVQVGDDRSKAMIVTAYVLFEQQNFLMCEVAQI